jgi:hypothetical protein
MSAMDLRDRIQRWWRPAQWKDDHPSQATGEPPKKHWWQGGRWFGGREEEELASHTYDSLGPDIERDFKKPR